MAGKTNPYMRQLLDKRLSGYIDTIPEAVLTTAGLYMDVATGKWMYKGAKSAFPKVLDMLRKGIPPAAKAATPSISNRYQDATVMDWDAESASFKPESMKPKRSPGRTTGTVPKKKKQQQKAQNKAKVTKRKNKGMTLSLMETPKKKRQIGLPSL